MKLYREVKCSDRLPEFDGWYLTDYGSTKLVNGEWRLYNDDSSYTFKLIDVIRWYEPYELPTEEEIWKPAMEIFSKRVDKFFEESSVVTKAQLYGAWHESFEAITNLLKGERCGKK